MPLNQNSLTSSDRTQVMEKSTLQTRLTPEATEAVCVALARWAVTILRSTNPEKADSR
jgi:hypothetical protein